MGVVPMACNALTVASPLPLWCLDFQITAAAITHTTTNPMTNRFWSFSRRACLALSALNVAAFSARLGSFGSFGRFATMPAGPSS